MFRRTVCIYAPIALQDLLRQWRTRATQNPAAYRPSLARTLNKLGDLYDDDDRLIDAEAAHKEAAAIRRELAAQDPAYRPDLGETLAHLGGVYGDASPPRFAEAEAAFKEAAVIRRELAAQDPAYRPDLAETSPAWALSMTIRTASPRPKPPSRRPPLSGVNWPPRTRPFMATSSRRSKTSLLYTGTCTAIATRKP